MTSEIARMVVRSFLERAAGEDETSQLSGRESEILWLVAEGLSNKEIGARLSISFYTVRTHLMHIYEKLHVRCRTEAAASTCALCRGAKTRKRFARNAPSRVIDTIARRAARAGNSFAQAAFRVRASQREARHLSPSRLRTSVAQNCYFLRVLASLREPCCSFWLRRYRAASGCHRRGTTIIHLNT